MKKLMMAAKAFWNDEEGATAIEYGLMVALIAVVIVAAVSTIGSELDSTFQSIADCLKDKNCGSSGSSE